MSYKELVADLAQDAEQLELEFSKALETGQSESFRQAIVDNHAGEPDNMLYAAWFYRLKEAAGQTKSFVIAWAWVIPLALINGFLFWLLSDNRFMITTQGFLGRNIDFMEVIYLVAGPLTALFVLIYFTIAGGKPWARSLITGALLIAAAFYVLITFPLTGPDLLQRQYLGLMTAHLPLLAWAGMGVFLMVRHRDPSNRFRFLVKSLEVFAVGGLFLFVLTVFSGITVALFDALSVNVPDALLRLFFAGGAGLIAMVAPAVIYNPAVPPADQTFEEGISKLLAFLMAVLVPLTLLVLVVYLLFIPFNFRAPFDNRDVLVIYNVMLFAVVALLVGATQAMGSVRFAQRAGVWFRRAMIAVAALATIIGLYALSAILYRTSIDRLTPNRLAFIGWNIINLGLLLGVLFTQARRKKEGWLAGYHRAFSWGTVAYAIWTLVVILGVPWIFGRNQAVVEGLPLRVQEIIYTEPNPILLKCSTSTHIYLVEDGQKRWIDNISTFEARGYVWSDVHHVNCADLRSIPDGVPIPAGAGPPPQP